MELYPIFRTNAFNLKHFRLIFNSKQAASKLKGIFEPSGAVKRELALKANHGYRGTDRYPDHIQDERRGCAGEGGEAEEAYC
jgi:hypothetical protein